MDFDAFTVGVTPDGLKSKDEIRILICYLLKNAHSPMSREMLTGLCFENGFANYFEASEALSDLVESENIGYDNNGDLILFKGGEIVADTLHSKLPVTVRERAMEAAVKLLARLRNESENEVSIEENAFGYLVTCKIIDRGSVLMSVGLSTIDFEQARSIRDRFLDSPSYIYDKVIDLLTKDIKND